MAFCASVSLILRKEEKSILCLNPIFYPRLSMFVRGIYRASKLYALAPCLGKDRSRGAESSRIDFVRPFETSNSQKGHHAHAGRDLQQSFDLVFHEALHGRGVVAE